MGKKKKKKTGEKMPSTIPAANGRVVLTKKRKMYLKRKAQEESVWRHA